MSRAVTLALVAALPLVAALALLAGGAPASAHTELLGSDPADGSSIDTAPERIALTFSEALQSGFTTVTIVGPDGAQWQAGPPVQDGGVVTVPVRPLAPSGDYTVGYRVLSADGHPVSGSVRFTLADSGPGTAPAPAPAPPGGPAPGEPAGVSGVDEGGTPVWPWIVGAVVLLGAGVVAALRLGRVG